jgi:hypothetical protein
MHTYSIIDGRWYEDGKLLGVGYSGRGAGKNRIFDPDAKMPDRADLEAMHNLGPIPRGDYALGPPFTHPILGPIVIPLTPVGHDARGRTHLLVHGDKRDQPPGNASSGCVVLGHFERDSIAQAYWRGDRVLRVVEILREVAA